jgi:hypothetical protein
MPRIPGHSHGEVPPLPQLILWFCIKQAPYYPTLDSIWKSKSLPKLRVFSWLLIRDRLNTKDLMSRKNWLIDGGSDCVLCSQHVVGTRYHMFFTCPFALACWNCIGITWDCSKPISARSLFTSPCFMEIVSSATWNFWKERNDLIFRNQVPSLGRWRVRFQNDLLLHQYIVKPALVHALMIWIQSTFI